MFGRVWKAIQQFGYWLGPTRLRVIFVILALTGSLSLMLNAVNPRPTWVTLIQSLLAVASLVGAVITVITRFPRQERTQMAILTGPALGALAIGLLFPQLFIVTLVMAAGWLVIAPITARSRVRREYQMAIKHMRKNEFDEAVKVMADLIKAEPKQADHYRFRAELYRLANNPKRARVDYEKVVDLAPESGVGYNGLAEVYLQSGEYQKALEYGRQALEHEKLHWVAAYNLGMIEDRLKMWPEAIEHLDRALEAGIPDSRHRLLAHLWIARANHGLNKAEETEKALAKMKREKTGLREWKTIFASEQAAVLRKVLTEDVELAERLIEGEITLDMQGEQTARD